MKKVKGSSLNNVGTYPDKSISTDKQLSRVLDSLLEGVQIIDFNWHYVYVNKSFTGFEQTTKENLLGRSILERYPGIESTDGFRGWR